MEVIYNLYKITRVAKSMEEEMAAHSSILAWRISVTEEPGGLLCVRSHLLLTTFLKAFHVFRLLESKDAGNMVEGNTPVEGRNAVTAFNQLLLGGSFTSVASALSLFPDKSCSTLLLPQGP